MWKTKNLTSNHFAPTLFFIWGVALALLYSIIAYGSFYEDPREVQVLIHSLLVILTAICFILFSLHKKFFSLLAIFSSLALLGVSGLYNWGDISFIAISSSFFTIMFLLPSIGLLYFAYWHEHSDNIEIVEQGSRKYILSIVLIVGLLLFIVGLFGFGVEIDMDLGELPEIN